MSQRATLAPARSSPTCWAAGPFSRPPGSRQACVNFVIFTFMRAVGAKPFLVSALRRFCVLYVFIDVAPRIGRRNLRFVFCIVWVPCRAVPIRGAARGGVRVRGPPTLHVLYSIDMVLHSVLVHTKCVCRIWLKRCSFEGKVAHHFVPRMVAEPSVDGLRYCSLYPPLLVGPPQ